jgi:aquaporin Z
MPWGRVGVYILVQLLAGILGGVSYVALFEESFILAPAAGFGWINAAICETMYTCMLCFVVLNVAVTKSRPASEFYGLAIGFVIIAGAYGAGAVSGGCFNPAVAAGIAVSGLGGYGLALGVYVLAELTGAFMAAILFLMVRPSDFSQGNSDGTQLPQKLISEFLGTFMLVFTVGLNVLAASPAAAFSIAAALMCMIYALGDVSGAHFNPAVTCAILAKGSIKLSEAISYMVVQFLGGALASCAYLLVWAGRAFPLGPVEPYGLMAAMAVEVIFTFVLCFVVLCVAVYEPTKNPEMFGLAIGSCVTVGGFAIGHVSGGSLNPAVSTSIAIAGGGFLPAICYIAAEITGGALASLLSFAFHLSKRDLEKQAMEEEEFAAEDNEGKL